MSAHAFLHPPAASPRPPLAPLPPLPQTLQVWRATSSLFMVNPHSSTSPACLVIQCPNRPTADSLQASLDAIFCSQQSSMQPQQQQAQQQQTQQQQAHAAAPTSNGAAAVPTSQEPEQANGSKPQGNAVVPSGNIFDVKTDKGSSGGARHGTVLVLGC